MSIFICVLRSRNSIRFCYLQPLHLKPGVVFFLAFGEKGAGDFTQKRKRLPLSSSISEPHKTRAPPHGATGPQFVH